MDQQHYQNEDEQVDLEMDVLTDHPEPPHWFRDRDAETRHAYFYARRNHPNNPHRTYIFSLARPTAPGMRTLRQLEQDLSLLAMCIRRQYFQHRLMRNRFNAMVRRLIRRNQNED